MNQNRRTLIACGLALVCLHPLAFAQTTNTPAEAGQTNVAKRLHAWWRDAAPGQRPYTANSKQMPLISVKGNKFVDPNGNTVLFRGLSISDPDKLELQGHWSREHFVKVKEMGAKLKSAKVAHKPVMEGECSQCHDPHASDNQRLLKVVTPQGSSWDENARAASDGEVQRLGIHRVRRSVGGGNARDLSYGVAPEDQLAEVEHALERARDGDILQPQR